MKTSYLEETLSDALEDDSFDLSVLDSSSQNESRLSTSLSEFSSTPDLSALTNEHSIIMPNSSMISLSNSSNNLSNELSISRSNATDFEAEASESINENAWGVDMNQQQDSASQQNQVHSNSKLVRKMSDKLFRNSSFSKRNPRKSLSRNSFGSSQSSQSLISNSQKDVLPDLETILSQKSKQTKDDNSENVEQQQQQQQQPQTSSTLINNIDENWLKRCNDSNGIDEHEKKIPESISEEKSTENEPRKFGISNINANVLNSFMAHDDTSNAAPKSMLSFDMDHLNLNSRNSFHSEMDAIGSECNLNDFDDEEIANSEDETQNESKPQIRSVRHSNKRKRDELDEPLVSKSNEMQSHKNQNQRQFAEIKKKYISTKQTDEKPVNDIIGKSEETIVIRKSSRNIAKIDKICNETNECDTTDSEKEEEDPFGGDDSDNDPNFVVEKENKQMNRRSQSTTNSSSDEKQKNIDNKKPEMRKRKPRIKSLTETKKTKTIKSRTKKSMRKTKIDSNSDTESAMKPKSENPDDYLIEFGIENIRNVPSISIDELKQNTQEFLKYANSIESTTTKSDADLNVTKATKMITKSSIAKEKLEKKVASGTLNENYVRLNLRKKIFVRGKKTLNFSRYKKKLWKSKKEAALTGPDMDMKGCDGGIFKCFQCGSAGHFAQNCKVKSELKYYSIFMKII